MIIKNVSPKRVFLGMVNRGIPLDVDQIYEVPDSIVKSKTFKGLVSSGDIVIIQQDPDYTRYALREELKVPFMFYIKDTSVSTTNTSMVTPTVYMTYTTPLLRIGLYKLDWWYRWFHASGNRLGRFRITSDTVSMSGSGYHEEEVQDIRNRLNTTGFSLINVSSSSSLIINLEFCTSGSTVTITNGRFFLQKVDN